MFEVTNLSKSFGDLRALNKVSFQVEDGELFGIIGQNGAGKSTLFRSIMDFYDKYEGTITYHGEDFKKVPLEKIGFLPEERSLDPKVSVEEEIRYFAGLNLMGGISSQTIKDRFDRFEVKGKVTDKIKDLSKGNQQKVQLICALIYEPEFVILDEPFSGLDPYNVGLMEEIIKEINRRGTTILFSSHSMENVENLCTRLIMLRKGDRVLYGSPKEIRNSYPRDKVLVESAEDLSFAAGEGIRSFERKDDLRTFYLEDESFGEDLFKKIYEKVGYLPYYAQLPPSLNEIFARKVEEDD